MAVVRSLSYAFSLQVQDKQSIFSPSKHYAGSCFLAVSLIPGWHVWGCTLSQTPNSHLSSSLADFQMIQADVVKQHMHSERKAKLEYYTRLTRKLAEDGYLLEAADLAAILVDAGIDRRYLTCFIKIKDIHSASSAIGGGYLDVFIAFVRKLYLAGFLPSRLMGRRVMTLLHVECRKLLLEGKLDNCIQALGNLSECGFAVRRLLDIKLMISTCAGFRNLDAALRYAGLLPRVNVHYNFIMQEFGRHCDLESAFTVVDCMTEAGIKPDMYTYRILIDACAHHGKVDKATSVFKDIVSSGNTPNVYVYNSMMNLYSEDTDAVWQLYIDMQPFGVEPDLVTYNILLKSCSLSKNFERAISLYKDMENSAASGCLKLDVVTYTTIIQIFGAAKMWMLAMKVKEDMVACGVAPNVMTWTALICASASVGMVEQAFSIFNEMLTAGCAPNEQTYNTLINACCKGSQHERAFQLFKEWKEKGHISSYAELEQRRLVSGSRLSSKQTCELLADKKMAEVEDMMKGLSVEPSGSRPDLVTYNILMKACRKDPYLVREIMEDVSSAGLIPDVTSWSTYIDAYGSSGFLQEAINLFNEMKEVGITPDVVVYTAVIKACVTARDVDKAFEFLKKLKEAGLRPNKVTYTTLFRAQRVCRKLWEVQRALALYEEMREAGYAPNDSILKDLLEQWAEGALEDSRNEHKTARFSLRFNNEISTGFSEYSKSLLQRVAVHVQDPDAEPNMVVNLHGLSKVEARIAVLAVLRIIKERFKQGYPIKDDLIIITGAGTPSRVPVIRQAVLHILQNELGLTVSTSSTECHIIPRIPPSKSNVDNFLPTNSEEHLIVDTNSLSGERQFMNIGTTDHSKPWIKSAVSFAVRKPMKFGRLVITKDALVDWLTKKGHFQTSRLAKS